MNHEEARKALFEGATVRGRTPGDTGVSYMDYRIRDGVIEWRNQWADDKWTPANGAFYHELAKRDTYTKLKPAWPKWVRKDCLGSSGDRLVEYLGLDAGHKEYHKDGLVLGPVSWPSYSKTSAAAGEVLLRSQAAAWLRANGHTAEADKIDPPKKPCAVSLLKTGQNFQQMTPAELDAAGYGKLPDVPKPAPVVEYEPAGTKPEVGDVVVEVDGAGRDGIPSRISRFDKGLFGGTVAVREDGRRFVLPWFDGPNARNRILKRTAKPAGLYSKFEVTKGGKPLDAGCFVLVPFKADGSVNDPAAVDALQRYRAHCEAVLSTDIAAWLSNPTSRNGMNRPKGA